MLEEGEQFYDYPELLERYRDRVLKLFGDIKAKYPEVTHISVFGEMFGGLYPHDGVKARQKVGLIQRGVCYTPDHEFYGFDIYLFTEEGGRFLPVDEVNEIFEACGFFYAKTLFRGTLAECLKQPNAFDCRMAGTASNRGQHLRGNRYPSCHSDVSEERLSSAYQEQERAVRRAEECQVPYQALCRASAL